MSAQFSKGDRVERRGCGDTGRKGTLTTPADSDDSYSQVTVAWDNGTVGTVRIGALRKVEPEFFVGQEVHDEDYDRLPIGAVTSGIRKVGEHEWRSDKTGAPMLDAPYATRFLTHLPDAAEHSDADSLTDSDTVTEPEGKDDVESEPLKEGTPVLLWVKVEEIHDDGDVMILATHFDGEEQYFTVTPDAIVRPDAGSLPPWIKPARCTSLATRAEDEGTFARCIVTQHGPHDFHNDGPGGGTWTTAEESGRLVESGGAS